MAIDIVDLNDPKYRNLSPVQLAMVRAAQSKKDNILAEAAEEKKLLFSLMVANNVVYSVNREYQERFIDKCAEEKVAVVKSDLDYQLAYEALGSEGNENGPYRYPENPNYTLTPSQRFLVVRNYYMGITDDPQARLKAYAGDTLARAYLGEFYETLYELLASYC